MKQAPYKGHDGKFYELARAFFTQEFAGSTVAHQVADALCRFDRLAAKKGKRPFFTKTKISKMRGVQHRNTTRECIKAFAALPGSPLRLHGFDPVIHHERFSLVAGSWMHKVKLTSHPPKVPGRTFQQFIAEIEAARVAKEKKARDARQQAHAMRNAKAIQEREEYLRDWGEKLGLGRPATPEEAARGTSELIRQFRAGMRGGDAELERRRRALEAQATESPPDRQAALNGDDGALLALQRQFQNKLKKSGKN